MGRGLSRVEVRALCDSASPAGGFRLQGMDIGEVAIGAGEVDAVANHELVWHLEAEVLHVELDPPARGLGEEGADLQGRRPAREQRAANIGERQPRVYDVLDY